MVFLRVPSTRRSDRFWQGTKICWVWGQGPQTQSPGGETPVPKSRKNRAKRGLVLRRSIPAAGRGGKNAVIL